MKSLPTPYIRLRYFPPEPHTPTPLPRVTGSYWFFPSDEDFRKEVAIKLDNACSVKS